MKKPSILSLVILVTYCGIVSAGDWANSDGSCYGKGSKNISAGISLIHIGFFGSFDYGFHDAISGGFATGFNTDRDGSWRRNYVPIVVRGAFHPFNLRKLAEKIKIRNKLDVYVGIATGWRIGSVKWESSVVAPAKPKVGGFIFREYIGIRFYPFNKFYILAEEGSGLGLFNFGVGFSF